MTTQQTSSNAYCAILINCSSLVLRLSHDEIKESYSDNPMYVAEYIENGMKENLIELAFDDQKATLSCAFDGNNTCNASYIFLDNLDELNNYISYLNKTYAYDYIQNRWTLPNSFISIKKAKDDIYFVSIY
ncbi:hypothetical protein [Dysgonomonas sp. HGC4]|uniref:hypothetical protein n=1 Tax=Dysgonomonas sp. HGC4 TaxID=1658009 RepID=UPI000681F2CD|nr:hypothetical protein [Dysgonomonas sp. HGC4]MBD8348065.1 hypothetical protein [Dysgonomonas sp. HGC4]